MSWSTGARTGRQAQRQTRTSLEQQWPRESLQFGLPLCLECVCHQEGSLVASDSSSSGGSDSEDEEKAAGTVETVSSGPGQEVPSPPRTEDAAGRAKCVDSTAPDPACPVPSKVTSALAMAVSSEATMATQALNKASPPLATPAMSTAVVVAIPAETIVEVTPVPATVGPWGV
ncbi:Serine/threonine-protein phosphatase 6 regulatory subunit 2 [Heterocephalus glaber]|uniref:Serine/threonine-protein phosphatase 6 regulatory subunit 2 n=1 Tax=Heterocephalus glaber TaxID=10181 RepID=G5C761_HETGA|nr:Serine/threonine-protein phosphatase 6 regulatory subunit 2 [Heterocephalus glaber]